MPSAPEREKAGSAPEDEAHDELESTVVEAPRFGQIDADRALELLGQDRDHRVLDALGPTRGPVWTVPVVANGRLCLRFEQRLVCYELMAS